MARLRKASFNGTVEFVTTSIETGMLFPCNDLVKFVVKAALTRAQSHHPLTISHLLVEGTHLHMIVVIENPEDLPGFMERFKTEMSHYLNRLLGRSKVTVWCDGYDSPTVLTVSKVIDRIAYIYTNPAKDGVCESIKKYPGLHTWRLFQEGGTYMQAHMISRNALVPISPRATKNIFSSMVNLLRKSAVEYRSLEFKPNAWMECFGINDPKEVDEINQTIIKVVEAREVKFNKVQNARNGYPSVQKLLSENFKPEYRPRRAKGRKMWCLSDDITQRKKFIVFIKSLVEEARQVYQNWKLGDFSKPFPAGIFPPRMRVTCNLINIF